MYMLTRQKNFQQICSSVKYIFKFKTRKTLCYDIIHISRTQHVHCKGKIQHFQKQELPAKDNLNI